MNNTGYSIRAIVSVAAILVCAACTFRVAELQETRQLKMPAPTAGQFSIDAGAGSLSLHGDPEIEQIEVTAEIRQVTADPDGYTLSLDTGDDGQPRLVARTDGRLGHANDRIDLTVRAPRNLDVFIHDGSGSMRVHDLDGNLEVDDGSGSIEAVGIGGAVVVDDGSGSLDVRAVGGDIRIEDGSGSISVIGAGGDVTIDDGSGSITVRDAAGKVTVSDGSGSITVDGAGDFELLDDGSGSVNLRNIEN